MRHPILLVTLCCFFALPALGKTYFMSSSGLDSNNGTSTSSPWLTPNHALNCGDVVMAAAGNYAAQSSFGTVTCPAGNNVAWLECVTFDACKIYAASPAPSHADVQIDHSYWGIQGWEVHDTSSFFAACFGAFPNNATPVQIHHIIFANNIANGCYINGFTTANEGNLVSSDYVAIIGNIAYNAAQGTVVCPGGGISIFQPVASDSLPGTHLYIAGNFSWDNVDGDPCNGGTPTDGEGITLDTLSGADTAGLPAYNQQIVVENNVLIYNGQAGLQTNANTSAPTFLVGNTFYGNNTDSAISSGTCGQLLMAGFNGITGLTYAYNNLSYSATAEAACAFSTPYAYFAYNLNATNKLYNSYAYNASGNNVGILGNQGFASGPNIVSSGDPAFAGPTQPGAPSCRSATSVPNCMATVIANFTPTNAAASGYGYQIPSTTSTYDPHFPQWLCNVNLPPGLVTMGCLQLHLTVQVY
jgi:hypothetical protein